MTLVSIPHGYIPSVNSMKTFTGIKPSQTRLVFNFDGSVQAAGYCHKPPPLRSDPEE